MEIHEQGPRRTNQLGGRYVNGKPLPREIRIQIIELARMGVRPCEISRQLKITHGCISKLLAKFQRTGSLEPGTAYKGRPRVVTSEIEEKIDEYRAQQPGIFSWELRDRLLEDGICDPGELPSLSSISRIVKRKVTQQRISNESNQESSSDEYAAIDRGSTYRHSIEEILSPVKDSYCSDGSYSECGPDSPVSDDSEMDYNEVFTNVSYQPFPLSIIRRTRTRFTSQQLRVLQKEFTNIPYPSLEQRKELAEFLDVNESRVQVWFSNKRAQGKRRTRSYDSDIEPLSIVCPCGLSSCPVPIPHHVLTGPSRLFFPIGHRL